MNVSERDVGCRLVIGTQDPPLALLETKVTAVGTLRMIGPEQFGTGLIRVNRAYAPALLGAKAIDGSICQPDNFKSFIELFEG